MNEYESRDQIIRSMGFPTYRDYLQSKLWRGIRQRALLRTQFKCVKCHGRAWEVHHTEYSRLVLEGKMIRTLMPVCRICHQLLEEDKKQRLEVEIEDWKPVPRPKRARAITMKSRRRAS